MAWQVMDGDAEFTGIYDVWIADDDEIIAATWNDKAALICAAPGLLEALELLLELTGAHEDRPFQDTDCPYYKARQLVAKAKAKGATNDRATD